MELEKDKWYRLTSGRSIVKVHWYVKFKYINDGIIKCTNYINDYKYFYNETDSTFGSIGDYTLTLIDLSEIQEYLPEDHIDKVQPEKLLITIL